MVQDITTIGRTLLDAIEAHDLGRWEAALAAEATFSYPGLRDDHPHPDGGGARAAARAYNAPFLAAFSDLTFIYDRTLVAGDTVVYCWRGRGTHDGPLALPIGTVPATGRTAEVPGVLVAVVRDGKIVREETYWNPGELLTQLGLA
jgi:ketosteroid isomerase-like protein